MAQSVAAVVGSSLSLRNLPFLQSIWQGGCLGLVDMETAPNVKQGFLNVLGHIMPTGGGASMQTKVKSAEFISAMATGVGTVEGEPISQMDPLIQVKVNAPSIKTLAALLFSTAPATTTQAVISVDTNKTLINPVLDVWYLIGAGQLTKIDVAVNADSVFTDLELGSDYLLDTEMGAIMFPSATTTVTSGDMVISILYQAAAIPNAPIIAPGALPKFAYAGVYIYTVLAANEARSTTEAWLRYIPRCRIKPSGNFDVSVDKPAEVTLDFSAVPSSEISGQPFGYLKQIAGTMRSIS